MYYRWCIGGDWAMSINQRSWTPDLINLGSFAICLFVYGEGGGCLAEAKSKCFFPIARATLNLIASHRIGYVNNIWYFDCPSYSYFSKNS